MNGYQAFLETDIRVGKIIEVKDFPEARRPAYKLQIDLGTEKRIKKSSAQITENYSKDELLNKTVLCLVNVAPRQVGPFISEVLTLGVPAGDGTVILISPGKEVPLGGKLY
mgnify:CR=1 FL=1